MLLISSAGFIIIICTAKLSCDSFCIECSPDLPSPSSFAFFPLYSQHVVEKKKVVIGSLLVVTMTCSNGHRTRWKSQPSIGHSPVGNLLMSCAILFSGCLYSTFAHLCDFLKLASICESTFYDHQKKILCPVVSKAWTDHVGSLHIVATGENLKFCGDGRCDSPGYSAKYCTYTLMESVTSLIFDFELVRVGMTKLNSGIMEREGLRTLLHRLQDAPFTVAQLATDRSTQIKAMMRDSFDGIAHQFDIWHFVKSVVKKLTKATTKQEMEILRKWIPSIANHLWWCCSTCGGNATVLREKWLSILDHIANQHSWTDATQFMACEHGEIPPDESKQWLTRSSDQHQALMKIVTDKTLLQDLNKLTDFCHTG